MAVNDKQQIENKTMNTKNRNTGVIRPLVNFGIVVLCAVAAPVLSWADTYKHKVQYLESTGTQYIDTGIIPAATTGCRITYEFMSLVDTDDCLDMIVGVTDGNLRCYPVALMYVGGANTGRKDKTKDVLCERYMYHEDIPSRGERYASRTRHTVLFNGAGRRLFVDGSYLGSYTSVLNGTKPFYFFAYNNNGSPKSYSASRIYGCKFFNNSTGALIARFIPVVDDDDRPAMFEEVEGKLHYNLGTGEFIAGPRKEEPWYIVEHIESSGGEYIDTGIIPSQDTMFRAIYEYMSVVAGVGSASQCDMIAGVSKGGSYYPVSINYKYRKEGANVVKYERYITPGSTLLANHPARTRHALVFNDANRGLFVDGAYHGTFNSFNKAITGSCYLFASNANGSPDHYAAVRNYGCEFVTNGALVASFLPAVAASGAVCMYDDYSGKNFYNRGTGAFTAGRIVSPVVTLDLSGRTDLAAGMKVFDFNVRPSYGTVFALDAATAANYDAQVQSDGVYLAAKGAGGEAANVITVTGSTVAQFKAGEMPTCASVVLSGTVTLADDCDWTGLGTLVIPDGVVIDLAGHDLTLSGFTALPHSAAVITDSSAAGAGGNLRVVVADGELVMNDRVALLGSLRLVKEGPGRFIAALPRQQYTGGTEIVGGTLTFGTDLYPLGQKNAVVKVSPGAVLDLGGRCNIETSVYNYDLAGTLRMSTKARKNGYSNAYKILGTAFSLSANATIEGEGFYFASASTSPLTLALNGYELTINVQNIDNTTSGYIGMGAFADDGNGGKIVVVNGETEWLSGGGFSDSVAVEYRSPAYFRINNSNVAFYDFTYSSGWWSNGYTKKVKLYGTYHAGSIRPPIEVQNGATLDLSSLDAPLDANAVAGTSGAMTFVSGTSEIPSTVNVNLAGRTGLREFTKSEEPYLFIWSSLPQGVTFVLDEETYANHYRIVPDEIGLRIKSVIGFTILLK